MYRIIDGRGTGKTGRLMLLAKENGGTIVCNNVHAMETKALRYGITGINFISYYDYLKNSKGKDLDNYYIDELESFIRYIHMASGVKGFFNGYTISEE